MAPPKADLNNKEKVPELETLPEAVVVDQNSEFRKNVATREQCKKKRRCRAGLICMGVGIVAIVIALPILVLHMKHHHRRAFNSWCRTDDHRIRVPEHVRIVDEKKLIFVNNTKTGGFDAFNALHDYENKMSAFRHSQSKRCFMEPLKKTFEEGIREWDRDDDDHFEEEHEHEKRGKHGDRHHGTKRTRFYSASEPTNPETASHYWGQHITDHCKNHKFHMLQPIEGPPPKPDSTTVVIKIASRDFVRVIFIKVNM